MAAGSPILWRLPGGQGARTARCGKASRHHQARYDRRTPHHPCATRALVCTGYFSDCHLRLSVLSTRLEAGTCKYTHMVASLPLDLLVLVLLFCSGDDVNIMPPLSVVDHAIYQSSHTNRKRISVLKNPPFNIARPSLAKNLKLYSDSMVVFVHACESGVFLPTLRDLDISPNRGFIGDAKMTEQSPLGLWGRSRSSASTATIFPTHA